MSTPGRHHHDEPAGPARWPDGWPLAAALFATLGGLAAFLATWWP